MKQQILRLWILVAVAVCILMYISLTACSNGDNNEPTDDGVILLKQQTYSKVRNS